MKRPSLAVLLALLVAVMGLTACGGQRNLSLRITEENKDKIGDLIKDSRDFTPEELQLLARRQVRVIAARVVGQSSPPWVGKTIAEAIDDERRVQAEEAVAQKKSDQLAAEAKAKQDAQADELRKAINLAVFRKTFRASNPSAGSYQDHISIECTYENTSGKDIRAFRGTLMFADLFGKEIANVTLTIQTPIAAGKKDEWSGTTDYNQFMPRDVALRVTELKDMKVTWVPISIIFVDGSQIGEK